MLSECVSTAMKHLAWVCCQHFGRVWTLMLMLFGRGKWGWWLSALMSRQQIRISKPLPDFSRNRSLQSPLPLVHLFCCFFFCFCFFAVVYLLWRITVTAEPSLDIALATLILTSTAQFERPCSTSFTLYGLRHSVLVAIMYHPQSPQRPDVQHHL